MPGGIDGHSNLDQAWIAKEKDWPSQFPGAPYEVWMAGNFNGLVLSCHTSNHFGCLPDMLMEFFVNLLKVSTNFNGLLLCY